MTPLSSVELLLRWRDCGDEQAVAEFWHRHHARVTALLRTRVSRKLGRRLDAEDLAQSAFGTFCARVRDGRILIDRGRRPSWLLTTIALRKLFRRLEREKAGCRSLDKEESHGGVPGSAAQPAGAVDGVPTGLAEQLAAAEELERIVVRFLPAQRRVIELHLCGYDKQAIADETSYTDRTVRAVLKTFHEELERRCAELAAP